MTPEFSFPCSADKKPRLKEWQRKLFQWQTWKFAPLVGVQTGKTNGFDVLDVDPKGLGWYDQNFDAIPKTFAQSTQRGMHLFFRAAEGLRCTTGKIAPGIDVKAQGGYVIWWRRGPTSGPRSNKANVAFCTLFPNIPSAHQRRASSLAAGISSSRWS
jgi:Bifunctional DNA primase/polymerase, N-terminal